LLSDFEEFTGGFKGPFYAADATVITLAGYDFYNPTPLNEGYPNIIIYLTTEPYIQDYRITCVPTLITDRSIECKPIGEWKVPANLRNAHGFVLSADIQFADGGANYFSLQRKIGSILPSTCPTIENQSRALLLFSFPSLPISL